MPAMKPEQIDELFAEAFNAGDAEALVSLYEADATFVAHTGEIISKSQALREYVEGLFALQPKIELRTAKVLQHGDLALVSSSWTVGGTDPDGNAVEMSGNSVVVLRQQADGSWRFAIDDPGWLPTG